MNADVKNVFRPAVCLHWVDNNIDGHNEFVGLKNMLITDTDSIVREFKDVLLRMRLRLDK